MFLFVDGLDEVLLKTGGLSYYNDLRFFIEELPPHWKVVIACRRSFWEPNQLRGPEPSFTVFHCDNLGQEVYQHLIHEDAKRAKFFTTTRESGIETFLDSPFIGFDLARSYLQGNPLPHSRQEWYEQQITKLLTGTLTDTKRGQRPTLARLKHLSQQLACLSVFCGVNVWTPQEAIDLLDESNRSLERPAQFDEVDTLLQTPLFWRVGDRFTFSHQSFIEYLAAMALTPLSLRKQRQLLEAPNAGFEHRILMPRRGIVIHLAEVSPLFRFYLISNDPLIAFLGESPGLSTEDEEHLLKSVFDQAITQRRAPWYQVPPRGEQPIDWLSKHHPRSVVDFVRPHLQNQDEFARLWATAAAAAWGGASELNDALLHLAHDSSEHVEIRKAAIEAIAQSKVTDDIAKLYDLLNSANDQVRGQALDAYRVTESPTPQDFIDKLRGGPNDENLHCLLEIEPQLYAQTLSVDELKVALHEADMRFTEIGKLCHHLLTGLIRRANELGHKEIPASLVLKIWRAGAEHEIYYGQELDTLLHDNSSLFENIFKLALERLAGSQNSSDIYNLPRRLVGYCTDQIFDLLPPEEQAKSAAKAVHRNLAPRIFLQGTFARTITSFSNAGKTLYLVVSTSRTAETSQISAWHRSASRAL